MTVIQIVILFAQLFIFYLTFAEMRKAREQQVLPFVIFGGGGETKSSKNVTTKIRVSNQGTGLAVKIKVYLGRQQIKSIAVLFSGKSREGIINLSENKQWEGLQPNKEMIALKATYENIYGKTFISTLNLVKNHDGFPKFIEESFSMHQEKSLFQILGIK